ncbi:MAG: LLM class flavin-dependent oxidoreductase, partial [Candidatus Bathyarchaeia archaeon]
MKFGLFLSVQHPFEHDMVAHFDEHMQQVLALRKNKFDSVWAGQHYLTTDYQMLHNVPLLSRVAAEAPGMTIGTGIVLLSLHNPVDIAEQIATLDIICHGNFVFGIGIGYREVEMKAFNLTLKDRARRFEEVLTIVKKLWTEPSVTFHGKYFHYQNLVLNLKPYQRPFPPIWIAANSDKAVERAAVMGDTWILNPHASLATLERQMMIYRKKLKTSRKRVPNELPIIKELYVAENDDKALREAAPFLNKKYEVYVRWGQHKALPSDDPLAKP